VKSSGSDKEEKVCEECSSFIKTQSHEGHLDS
jgi:hypothetical protein